MKNKCFNCNEIGSECYEFIICDTCKKELKLFSSSTVQKHVEQRTALGYKIDIIEKLALLETTYIKKRIKLLDILSKIEE